MLVDKKYLTVSLDPSQRWLHANWIGDQNLQTVKEGSLLFIDLITQTGVNKAIVDNREVTSSWSEAANWGGTVAFPAMFAAGLRHLAWVYSPFVFSRLSTDTAISYSKNIIQTATFETLQEAEAWLVSVGNS